MSEMDPPILYRFGSRALDRVRLMLDFRDSFCSEVLSAVPIQDGVCYGFFAPAAKEWLGRELFESCLPVALEEMVIGMEEERRFIAEYLTGGELDRICLLFSTSFDRDPGVESMGFPHVFLPELRASEGSALWFFLQGSDVSVDDADEAINWAAEWPAIHILTRTGLTERIQARSKLAPELLSDLAKNTQFIMVGAFDCGERLIWSRSDFSFHAATTWFRAEGSRDQKEAGSN